MHGRELLYRGEMLTLFFQEIFQYCIAFSLKREEQITILLQPKHYIKKNINGKSISVRLRKGIFKNNSETVTLDGNSDLWAENLKRILQQKCIFRDIQEDFQKSKDPGLFRELLLVFLNHQSKTKNILNKKEKFPPKAQMPQTKPSLDLFLIL